MSILWTNEEKEYLLNNWNNKNKEDILLNLNRRNWKSINRMAVKLGLKNNYFWSKEDECFVLNNYMSMDTCDLANILNKTIESIKHCARKLGVSKKKIRAKNTYIQMDDYVELEIKNKLGIFYIKIDTLDLELISNYKWNISAQGYAVTRHPKSLLMHRLVLNCEKGKIVDHINNNKLDNRRANLRICSVSENNQNIDKKCRGVANCGNGIYFSNITINKKRVSLKYGTNINELSRISEYARAYAFPFSKEYQNINQSDIPQWIKDKIDKVVNNANK